MNSSQIFNQSFSNHFLNSIFYPVSHTNEYLHVYMILSYTQQRPSCLSACARRHLARRRRRRRPQLGSLFLCILFFMTDACRRGHCSDLHIKRSRGAHQHNGDFAAVDQSAPAEEFQEMDQRDFLHLVVLIAFLLPCFHQVATVYATEPLLNGRATLYCTDLLLDLENAVRIANCNAAVNSLPIEPVMYSCRIGSRNNVIRIWCTGHDDPIKYSEFVTRHGLTNTQDRGMSWLLSFSHYSCFVIVFDAAVYYRYTRHGVF